MHDEARFIGEQTRLDIELKFLLATKPQGYVIPPGFKIRKIPCQGYARGATKPKSGAMLGAMLGATCPRKVWK